MTRTHFGVIMTGSRDTRWRSISNDALPDPITIDAETNRIDVAVSDAELDTFKDYFRRLRISTEAVPAY